MSLAREVFDRTVRPRLPPKRVRLGGVECYAGSVLDRSLGDIPGYEAEMRRALREHVDPGDMVRVVGGGAGVTAVVAAELGATSVEVVEATAEGVDRVRRTADLNDVGERVHVLHGVIGEVRDAWGERIGPARSADWCRHADVLEIDCEGGEQAILSRLAERPGRLPETLLAESHGSLGSPTTRVREQVRGLGYEIVSEEWERESKDVKVLAAVLDE